MKCLKIVGCWYNFSWCFFGAYQCGIHHGVVQQQEQVWKPRWEEVSRNCCGFWVNLALPVDFIQKTSILLERVPVMESCYQVEDGCVVSWGLLQLPKRNAVSTCLSCLNFSVESAMAPISKNYKWVSLLSLVSLSQKLCPLFILV